MDHKERLLLELIQHPGWVVFIDLLKDNQVSLIQKLYEPASITEESQIIYRWRLLETLVRKCSEIESTANIVKLGMES